MSRSILLLAATIAWWTAAAEPARKVEFNRDIRPILSENCFLCHGPDKSTRKAKLRLDVREDAIEHKAFVPGKSDESELVKRLISKDPEEIMPPPETKKTLTETQRATLKAWIDQGAPYEAHWAYTPLKRPTVPDVQNKAWVINPIDAFVLKPLEDKKVTPSRETNKRELLRRVSLDVTGLPPTPDEVQAFLDDASTNAYEKQVDRLLASPHFGERMAVWWLDVARFTDTVGYHGDQNQRIYPYRDYVIDSFNKNKPFDAFTIEQLAGDLLPNPTPEQRVATGFNRLNMMTREGGAQPKEYLAKYGADRVRTVAGTWLGSTMGCCECHDHKFDPFSTRDFYSMKAFFADMKQWGVYADYNYTPNPDLKGFNNDFPFPPEIEVENTYLKQRIAHLRTLINDVCVGQKLSATQKSALEKWRASASEFLQKNPDGWNVPPAKVEVAAVPVATAPKKTTPSKEKKKIVETADKAATEKKSTEKSPDTTKKDQVAEEPKPDQKEKEKDKEKEKEKGEADIENKNAKEDAKPSDNPAEKVVPVSLPVITQAADGSFLFTGKSVKNSEQNIRVQPQPGWIAAVRLELLPNEKLGGKFTRDEADSTVVVLSAKLKTKKDGKETKLNFFHADADLKEEYKYNNGDSQTGILLGWKSDSHSSKSKQTGEWQIEKPFEVHDGDTILISLKSDNLGSFRIATSPFDFERVQDSVAQALKSAVEKSIDQLDSASLNALCTEFSLSTGTDAQLFERQRALRKSLYECRDGKTHTMVTEAKELIETRVLRRGNFLDDGGDVVTPAVPHFLTQPADATKRRLTRLDLAKWLVSAENPLTGRAVMNRLWKQFFGNGLSIAVDDLGAQGEWPTHFELLDWLAVDFRENGWNVKHALKQIVMSNAYRQDSNLRGELRDWDPLNRYLSSQNPRRLDAEFVRDNALSIAGLLNLDIGGPSVKPYQPPNYYANLQFPNRTYTPDTDEREYRRGVYMHWQRTFLHPMLANFDAPMRDECTCTRTVSNTPQQALTLLNDPEFFEAARAFAQRVFKATSPNASDGERIDRAFQFALARSAKTREVDSLKKFLEQQRSYFKANPTDAEKVLKIGMTPLDKSITPDELAAWSEVCRVMLNLHETITKY